MSLFTAEGKQHFINRVQRLNPDAQAQWGKMNVAQMFTHIRKALDTSAAGKEIKEDSPAIKLMSFLFGKVAKKQLLSADVMKRNMPTATAFRITGNRDFETEKQNLVASIEAIYEKGVNGGLSAKHPFFGTMSVSDWDRLHTKHLEHHLSQFGV